MIQFFIIVSIFWSLIHFLNFQLKKTTNSITTTTTTRNNNLKGTKFDLTFLSFHLSTTNFNQLPSLLLKPFKSSKRSKEFNSIRNLKSFWDFGTFIVIFGIFIAQFVLLWSAFKSFSALWTLLRSIGGNAIVETAKKLVKRIIESTPSAASSLVIRPVVSRSSLTYYMYDDLTCDFTDSRSYSTTFNSSITFISSFKFSGISRIRSWNGSCIVSSLPDPKAIISLTSLPVLVNTYQSFQLVYIST